MYCGTQGMDLPMLGTAFWCEWKKGVFKQMQALDAKQSALNIPKIYVFQLIMLYLT